MKPGGYGLDAPALTRQQQALAVVFQRLAAAGMPGRVGRAINIGCQAQTSRASPRGSGRPRQFDRKMFRLSLARPNSSVQCEPRRGTPGGARTSDCRQAGKSIGAVDRRLQLSAIRRSTRGFSLTMQGRTGIPASRYLQKFGKLTGQLLEATRSRNGAAGFNPFLIPAAVRSRSSAHWPKRRDTGRSCAAGTVTIHFAPGESRADRLCPPGYPTERIASGS